MGLWGAAQAIAFAIGGLMATLMVDIARHLTGSPVDAYATVFVLEAMLFVIAAVLAARLHGDTRVVPPHDRAMRTGPSVASLESR